MVRLSSIIRTFNVRNIGTCATCMRISFLAMALSWLLVLAALTLDLNAKVLIYAVSIGLTLLWLAHIITRAARSMHPSGADDYSRRLAIRTFVKAAVGAAVVSGAAFPWQAHADSGCGGWSGNSGCSPCSACQRQTSDCQCYSCRSCGSNCSGSC